MTNADIELKSWGTSPKSKLFLDGQDVSSQVLGLNLYIEPVTHNRRLELYLFPAGMDIELRATHVLVDAATHDLLVRLGWTPPTEDKEAMG